MGIIRRPEGGQTRDGNEFRRLEEGYYTGKCVFAEAGESPKKGDPQIEFRFEVRHEGRTHKLRYWLDMRFDWKVEQIFEHFLVERRGEFVPINSRELDERELVGGYVGLKIVHRDKYANVDKLARADRDKIPDSRGYKAPEGYGRRYDEGGRREEKQRQPERRPVQRTMVDDDDIPF